MFYPSFTRILNNLNRQIWDVAQNIPEKPQERDVRQPDAVGHLSEIDQTARKRVESIAAKLLTSNPAPDKATNPMGWTGHMNNLRYQAEETVLMELIYN